MPSLNRQTGEPSGSPPLKPAMALDLYDLNDHGATLLNWSTATPAGQQRMAADLQLLAELHALTTSSAPATLTPPASS
jgi:hypothetical protein